MASSGYLILQNHYHVHRSATMICLERCMYVIRGYRRLCCAVAMKVSGPYGCDLRISAAPHHVEGASGFWTKSLNKREEFCSIARSPRGRLRRANALLASNTPACGRGVCRSDFRMTIPSKRQLKVSRQIALGHSYIAASGLEDAFLIGIASRSKPHLSGVAEAHHPAFVVNRTVKKISVRTLDHGVKSRVPEKGVF